MDQKKGKVLICWSVVLTWQFFYVWEKLLYEFFLVGGEESVGCMEVLVFSETCMAFGLHTV